MDVYDSEQEQIEAIKKWWKENGVAILLGLVLGLGGVFGWRWWVGYQDQRAMNASGLYEAALAALAQGGAEQTRELADQLAGDYADTPYAVLAAFAAAKVAVDGGDLDAAEGRLRWALDHAESESYRHMARLRLARVLISADRAEDALALLQGAEAGSFAPRYDELRGDALARLGRRDEARAAYAAALAALPAPAENRDLLQMKLNDLAAPVTGKEGQ